MQITQDILLPVLLAAIVANTVILVLLVVLTRFGRGDHRMTTTRSIMEGSMLSTSFVDRSARSSWQASDAPPADGPRDEAADAADAALQEDDVEGHQGGSVRCCASSWRRDSSERRWSASRRVLSNEFRPRQPPDRSRSAAAGA